MNAADFDKLDQAEKKHFYKCEKCGEMVDMRQLDAKARFRNKLSSTLARLELLPVYSVVGCGKDS